MTERIDIEHLYDTPGVEPEFGTWIVAGTSTCYACAATAELLRRCPDINPESLRKSISEERLYAVTSLNPVLSQLMLLGFSFPYLTGVVAAFDNEGTQRSHRSHNPEEYDLGYQDGAAARAKYINDPDEEEDDDD